MQLRQLHLLAVTAFLFTSPVWAATDADNIACAKAISQGDTDSAVALSDKLLKQNKHDRDALICKGRALNATDKSSKAIPIFQQAERASQSPVERIVALDFLGNAYRGTNQYVEAIASYEKALALSRGEKDAYFERINLNLIGDAMVDSGQVERGLENYMAGSKLAANDNERADGFSRIAAASSQLGLHDQAVEYQIKTMMMQERGGDLDDYANATLELARIYTVAKDFPNAERYIHKVIKLSKDNGGPYWEAKSYYYLASAKLASGKREEVQTLLADAQQICDRIGAKALNDQVSKMIDTLATE